MARAATQKGAKRRDREQDILSAARDLFRERSFDGTNIADIAARAGTAIGTVYLCARDKSDLLHKVLADFVEQLTQEIERDLSAIADPLARVRYVVSKHLRTLLSEPELCALFVREVHAAGREGSPMVQSLKQRYAAVLSRVLDEAMTAGVLRDDVPLAVARSVVFGGLEHMTLKTWTGRVPLEVEAATDGLLRMLVRPPEMQRETLPNAMEEAIKRLEAVTAQLARKGETP